MLRNAFSPNSNQDLGLASITSVPTDSSHLITRIFPMEGVLKNIVSSKKLQVNTFKSLFYNPRTGAVRASWQLLVL